MGITPESRRDYGMNVARRGMTKRSAACADVSGTDAGDPTIHP